MLTVLLVLLTVSCALLTVAFLGALRTLAAVRLQLHGYGGAGTAAMRIDFGRKLPDALVAAFPRSDGDGLVAFLSGDCETCWGLADELGAVGKCPVVACLVGGDEKGLGERLGPGVIVAPRELARDVAEELRIDATPVVVLHRDGYIVASAIGTGVRDREDIDRLWLGIGPSTNGGRRHDED